MEEYKANPFSDSNETLVGITITELDEKVQASRGTLTLDLTIIPYEPDAYGQPTAVTKITLSSADPDVKIHSIVSDGQEMSLIGKLHRIVGERLILTMSGRMTPTDQIWRMLAEGSENEFKDEVNATFGEYGVGWTLGSVTEEKYMEDADEQGGWGKTLIGWFGSLCGGRN